MDRDVNPHNKSPFAGASAGQVARNDVASPFRRLLNILDSRFHGNDNRVGRKRIEDLRLPTPNIKLWANRFCYPLILRAWRRRSSSLG